MATSNFGELQVSHQ